jgi:hypothetical protein
VSETLPFYAFLMFGSAYSVISKGGAAESCKIGGGEVNEHTAKPGRGRLNTPQAGLMDFFARGR